MSLNTQISTNFFREIFVPNLQLGRWDGGGEVGGGAGEWCRGGGAFCWGQRQRQEAAAIIYPGNAGGKKNLDMETLFFYIRD
jgi:hypothetical protein